MTEIFENVLAEVIVQTETPMVKKESLHLHCCNKATKTYRRQLLVAPISF